MTINCPIVLDQVKKRLFILNYYGLYKSQNHNCQKLVDVFVKKALFFERFMCIINKIPIMEY